MTRLPNSLLLLALAAPLASAQSERRTGVVGAAKPPRPLIASVSDLEARGHLPEGYGYVFTGTVETTGGVDRLVVSRIALRSPDAKTQLSLERVEGTFALRQTPDGLVLRRGARSFTLERNTGSQLDRYLDEALREGGPENFTLRGWAITRSDRTKRSILVDGVDVRVERKGLSHAWARRIYGETVLLAPSGKVERALRRKHVAINRSATLPIYLPAFAGQPGEVLQRGTIGTKRAPTTIANYGELKRLRTFRKGDTYVFAGQTQDQRFEVERISLESPDGGRTQTLARFEGVFQVSKRGGRVVLNHEGLDRTIERNSGSQLERYLAQSLRDGEAGGFKLRGWLIDDRAASAQTHTALLDGLAVDVERKGLAGVWAERVYDKGRTVLLESDTTVQWSVKRRHVAIARRPIRAGLTDAMTAVRR